jgi:chromosome segregation ATPase
MRLIENGQDNAHLQNTVERHSETIRRGRIEIDEGLRTITHLENRRIAGRLALNQAQQQIGVLQARVNALQTRLDAQQAAHNQAQQNYRQRQNHN